MGGIPYSGLYGPGQALPEAASEGATAHRIEVPLATDPPAPFVLPAISRAVLVDNPSGVWYRVGERWVPPWTVGAIVYLERPTAELKVRQRTPATQYSEPVGEALVLVATSQALPPHPGMRIQPGHNLQSDRVDFTSPPIPPVSGTLIVPGVANRRAVLRHLALEAGTSAGALGTYFDVAHWVLLRGVAAPPPVELATLAVGPGAPHAELTLPEPGLVHPTYGDGIEIIGGPVQQNSAVAYLSAFATWYYVL